MNGSVGPLLLQGWREAKVPVRSKLDFSMPLEVLTFLTDVAWNPAAAELVAKRFRMMPSRRDYVLLVWLPAILGVVGYLVVALGGVALSSLLLSERYIPLGFVVSIILALACLIVPTWRQTRLDSAYKDVLVMNRLIRVLDISDAVQSDLTSDDIRRQLAKEIHEAGDYFFRSFKQVKGLTRETRKRRKRHARQCAEVLHTYADIALHGDNAAIEGLRADFGRAILRIGSGNWVQVANLNPSVQVERKWLDVLPNVDPKVVTTILAAVLLQLIQLTVTGGPKP